MGNAAVYADAGENKPMLEQVGASMEHDRQLRGSVELLIHGKRMAFGGDHRLIGEYKLFRDDAHARSRSKFPGAPRTNSNHGVPTKNWRPWRLLKSRVGDAGC